MKTVNIYNITGQLIKSVLTKGASEVRLDVSEWAAGVYSVEALDCNGISKKGKFVK